MRAITFSTNQTLPSSVFFTLALLFKQTTLYFAPAFFCVLLGEAFWGSMDERVDANVKANPLSRSLRISAQRWVHRLWRNRLIRVAGLGIAVLGSVVLVLFPFRSHLPQVYRRVFPFGRGVFEDYVSNFWCLVNPVLKVREIRESNSAANANPTTPEFAKIQNNSKKDADISSNSPPSDSPPSDSPPPQSRKTKLVFRCSLFLTFSSAFLSCIPCFFYPTLHRFLLALFGSSMSFYLFSWQVHEKAILLPLLPCLLSIPFGSTVLRELTQRKEGPKAEGGSTWCRSSIHFPTQLTFLLVAHVSLLPLALKDCSVLSWVQLSGVMCLLLVFAQLRVLKTARFALDDVGVTFRTTAIQDLTTNEAELQGNAGNTENESANRGRNNRKNTGSFLKNCISVVLYVPRMVIWTGVKTKLGNLWFIRMLKLCAGKMTRTLSSTAIKSSKTSSGFLSLGLDLPLDLPLFILPGVIICWFWCFREPPERLPFLFPFLLHALCAVFFLLFWIRNMWFVWGSREVGRVRNRMDKDSGNVNGNANALSIRFGQLAMFDRMG
jgi:hypothetical protein